MDLPGFDDGFDTLAPVVILKYDASMKTAISLPDELFEEAEALAEDRGVSRSELYATALAEYVAKHRDAEVTEKLNEVYTDEPSGLHAPLREAQARSVGEEW